MFSGFNRKANPFGGNSLKNNLARPSASAPKGYVKVELYMKAADQSKLQPLKKADSPMKRVLDF